MAEDNKECVVNLCENCGESTHNSPLFGTTWCEKCEGKLAEEIEKRTKTRQLRSGEF